MLWICAPSVCPEMGGKGGAHPCNGRLRGAEVMLSAVLLQCFSSMIILSEAGSIPMCSAWSMMEHQQIRCQSRVSGQNSRYRHQGQVCVSLLPYPCCWLQSVSADRLNARPATWLLQPASVTTMTESKARCIG